MVPTSLDFGTVTTGTSSDLDFTITNTGGGVLSGTVSESCDHYSIVSGGGMYSLGAGQLVAVTVRFEPTSAGTHPCTVETGDALCSDVSCTGVGELPPACAGYPTNIDFGVVAPNDSIVEKTFTIKNVGGGVLTGAVGETCDHYEIVSGGGMYSLGPGDSVLVTLHFAPTTNGLFECDVETGAMLCSDVHCTGLADETIPTLVQHYESRWFGGRVEIRWVVSGSSSSLSFEILRREGESGNYVLIRTPEIVRNGDGYVFQDASAEPGKSYGYRVGIVEDGREIASFETSLAVPDLSFALEQNYPNPFNPSTRIEFSVDREAHVLLAIYDISGRRVATIVDRRLAPGGYTEEWDARDANGREAASGVYFIRLTAEGRTLTRKTVLLR